MKIHFSEQKSTIFACPPTQEPLYFNGFTAYDLIIPLYQNQLLHEFFYSSKYQRDELRIKKALVFIEKNYDSPIALEEIAKSASISPSTCLRLFDTVLSTTPIQYLMRFRLQKAAEELTRLHGKRLSEIAFSCGFSDASYFNRCFRREYGMTPTEYISRHVD